MPAAYCVRRPILSEWEQRDGWNIIENLKRQISSST